MSKKRDCVRLHPYVERALAHRLAVHVAARGLSESAVVEAALRHHLDDEDSATTRILQALDRLGRAEARLQRDIELLSEAFAIWVQFWFAHTPSIGRDGKDYARRTAESRYKQFTEEVAHTYQNGPRFFDDLSALRLDGNVEPAPPAPAPPTETGAQGGQP